MVVKAISDTAWAEDQHDDKVLELGYQLRDAAVVRARHRLTALDHSLQEMKSVVAAAQHCLSAVCDLPHPLLKVDQRDDLEMLSNSLTDLREAIDLKLTLAEELDSAMDL